MQCLCEVYFVWNSMNEMWLYLKDNRLKFGYYVKGYSQICTHTLINKWIKLIDDVMNGNLLKGLLNFTLMNNWRIWYACFHVSRGRVSCRNLNITKIFPINKWTVCWDGCSLVSWDRVSSINSISKNELI